MPNREYLIDSIGVIYKDFVFSLEKIPQVSEANTNCNCFNKIWNVNFLQYEIKQENE